MSNTAQPQERGIIPPAMRRKIAACLRQGLSIRKIAAELDVPFDWVRRINTLHTDEVAKSRARPVPADPSHKSIARQETDDEMSRDRMIAINASVLADLQREYGAPENCPSLAPVKERPEELLPWRRPVLTDVTALVFGDPPPGRSALAMRGR
jgi:transposase-like protein